MEGDVASCSDFCDGAGDWTAAHVTSQVGTADVDDGPDDAASVRDAGWGWTEPWVDCYIPAWISVAMVTVSFQCRGVRSH